MRIPSLVFKATLFSALVAGCHSETNEVERPASIMTSDVDITLYSPAPPQIMLHAQNVEIGKIIEACPGVGTVTTIPMALPDSINTINSVDPAVRPYHLPIVTTLDFVTARDGTAPDWHGYDRANPDLLFVASLYDVAFGVLTFDPDVRSVDDLRGKNIGVPPRPSAVRWMSEALFGDGWEILDDINFVPLVPPQLAGALDAGDIDAMTWNIMSETPKGFLPMIPPLMDRSNAHWVDIDAEAVANLNAARPFTVERITLGDAPILSASGPMPTNAGFISFKQALAAWADTPEPLVRAIKSCLQDGQSEFGAGVDFETKALSWPGLDNDIIHPDAR